MANIILLGDGENHEWYDWISTEVVKRGHSFFLPELPPVKEGMNAWIESLKDYRKHFDESSVLIGHGAGRLIVLKILEEKLRDIKGAILISGKTLREEFPNFQLEELDFKVIKEKSKNFFVYATEHDDDESVSESEEIAQALEDELLIHEGEKYFKKQDKFEDLLIDIISLCD